MWGNPLQQHVHSEGCVLTGLQTYGKAENCELQNVYKSTNSTTSKIVKYLDLNVET